MYRRIYALEHLFHRRRNLSKLLAVGVQAPEFTLANQDNKPVSLSDFRGTHNVVIFFYPRAMTPGCTKQACGVRDTRDSFQSLDTVVLGISNDPPDKLKEFQNKHNLNFDLLADIDLTVSAKFGTWSPRKSAKASQRSTFIIDKSGKVACVIPAANPVTHDDDVLNYIRDNLA